LALLPIESGERIPEDSPPRGCVPGGTESAGTTRIPGRILRFRKAPAPDPLFKNESQPQSGQLHHHPTRTDGTITASLCPARDGMHPGGPSRIPPGQPACRRRKIDRIHPLDREKILLGGVKKIYFAGDYLSRHFGLKNLGLFESLYRGA
jgi:hypothetical protein